MSNKVKIGFVILAVTLFALWLSHTNKRPASVGIHVSANLPLTGSLATYGVAVREGADMALQESDEKSDPSGSKITIDWQDNAGDPKIAVSVMQKQLMSPVDIYVSGVKPQTMAIKEQISSKGIPHFVWIFDAYINSIASSNNLRTWVSYKIEPPIYFDYASRRAAKRIAITYVRLPHTLEEFDRIVIPGFRERGISEIIIEPYDFGRSDFKDIAVKIANFKPDLLILNGFQSDLVGLVRSLRPMGVISDGNTIATYDFLDAASVLGKDEVEGIRMIAPVFETRPETSRVAEWRTKFKNKYKKDPLYTHAFAYDMVAAISEASHMIKLPASHSDWLSALRSVNTQGITGPIRFDSDGDMITPLEVGVYRNGELCPDQTTK